MSTGKIEYPPKYFPQKPFSITISELEPKQKYFLRVGTLPYFKKDGQKYVLLGIDARFGSYCDFGGKTERNERWKVARRREFNEESYGLIEYSKPKFFISTYRSILVFSEIDPVAEDISDKFLDAWYFRKEKTDKCFHETKKAIILDINTFCELIQEKESNPLWGYIKDMCKDKIEDIKQMMD